MADMSTKILTGGNILFFHKRFINHYNYLLDQYEPPRKLPFAFYLSCSKYKPYYKSPYHRIFRGSLKKRLGIESLYQKYTVSEPAIIVPRELEDSSVTQYDFPPEQLGDEGQRIFIERLANVLKRLTSKHQFHFYLLPKHHRRIFEEAIQLADLNGTTFTYAPPGIFNLPKVRKLVREAVIGTEWEEKVSMEDNFENEVYVK